MSSIHIQRTTFREATLAFALGTLGTLIQLACGGGGGGGTTTPPPLPVPVITSFTAAKTPITAGTSTTLAGVFANGTGSVDKGVGAVTSGIAGTVSPSADTTYTLTVTNAAGAVTTATAAIAVVAAPAVPVITAPANVTASQAGYTATIPAQAGATYAWTLTNGSLTSATSGTSVTFTAGATGSVSLSCTVTNAAGTTSAAGVASSTIVAAPVATSLVATANPVPFRGTTAITPTFSGGIASVDQGVGAVTSGTPFSSGAVTGAKTFTLTVTNAAGSVATSALILTAQVVSVGAITPALPIRTAGTSTTFSATATGGATNSLAWSASAGTMIASTGVWTAPASAQTVTITATSVDDPTKSATAAAAVVAVPTTPVITAPANVTANQAGYTASIPAQAAGSTYGWTLTNGTVTAGLGTPSITFTPGASGAVGFSVIATNAAGTASAAGIASSTIVAAPTTPVVTAPANVTASLTGYTASIPAQAAGSTYVWTLTNGTVTAGLGTTNITFTPGASGAVGFSVVATNVAGTASAAGTANSTIAPQPTIPIITAPANVTTSQTGYTASIPAQAAGSTYVWTLTNGTVTAGLGTTNITFTPGASGSVGFSVVATNAAGSASTAGTASSTIVAAPTTPVITAPAYVTTGQGGYTASIPAQSGITRLWTITNGTLTSGNTGNSVTFAAGATGSLLLSCKVTNAAGTAVSGSASSTIVPFPTISLLSAGPADVASGAASTLSHTFNGGTGVITPGNITVSSGGTTVVHPVSTTTYTLTVTSPAGATITDTATVTVGAAPVISTFKTSSSTITVGQGALLSFTFTGDGAINQGVGTVTSGSQVAVNPSVTTTYTLSATNAVGATTTATATVIVKAYTGKFVYVANAGGGVSGFSLNDGTGSLAELGNSPFDDGVDALHVTSDPQGKFLFVVNGDGQANLANTLTVFQIDQSTGDLTKVSTYPTGSNPWASAVDPSSQYVYVRCAGSISAFRLDGTTGVLTPLGTPTITTTGGTGEVLVHPSGQYLFTVGRSSDQLQVFNLNPANGALSLNSSYGMAIGTGPLALALSHSGEYLFTKSEGAPGGAAEECVIYGFYLDVQTGGLTPLAGTSTGLQQADAYHGVAGNPTQPVIYITLATSANDYAAYALNLVTGQLMALSGSTYDLFGGTGSDSLVVSRKGDWGFMTDYTGGRIAVGAVHPSTGVLTNPTFLNVGLFPVSVTVVGTVQ